MSSSTQIPDVVEKRWDVMRDSDNIIITFKTALKDIVDEESMRQMLNQERERVIETGKQKLILDLSAMPMISTAFVGALLVAQGKIDHANKDRLPKAELICVVKPTQEHIKKTLHLTSADQRLAIVNSLDDAITYHKSADARSASL